MVGDARKEHRKLNPKFQPSVEMGTPSLRPSSLGRFLLVETLTLLSPPSQKTFFCSPSPFLQRRSLKPRLSTTLAGGTQCTASVSPYTPSTFKSSPISEEALMGFITGKRKATEVAHSVWKNIIQKGDTVVDATCGNGYDTLALLKMITDESCMGCVYGMDIQHSALESTSSLLEKSVDKDEMKVVKLFLHCHSKMEDIVPKDIPVRLIAFNLGYLPGGDKAIVTMSQTTLMALQAASRILMPGGLISMVVYVGHPGGRDELETVQSFASSLPAETWVSCKFEVLNRPTGPILVLLFKK